MKSLQMRKTSQQLDYVVKNAELIQSMCTGRELKKRVDLSPDAPEIHNYGN